MSARLLRVVLQPSTSFRHTSCRYVSSGAIGAMLRAPAAARAVNTAGYTAHLIAAGSPFARIAIVAGARFDVSPVRGCSC
jgi:hypothetical protein